VFRSTQSASPVSSQSTVDIDVSKPAGGAMDPGFDNPSIDLSSFAHSATPHSGTLLASLAVDCALRALLSFSETLTHEKNTQLKR